MARRIAARRPLRDAVAANRSIMRALGVPEDKLQTPASLAYLDRPKRAYAKRVDSGASEAQVLKSVLAYLRRHPKIETVERSQSGVFMEGSRVIRVGFVGKLDITFMTKRGQYGEIEVKRPGGKPTEVQAARIAKIKAAGGVSGCASSIEEIAEILSCLAP